MKHVCTTAERVKNQVVDFVKNVDWKKVAVTAGAIGVGIALTVATGGLGAPVAMAIGGAASGAIISGYDAYSSGQRGWELVGSIAKGAGTGAISGLIGGQLMGAGASLATNVTQNIGNQAVRQVAKIGVESAVETAIDTGIDLATGNKITGQTVAMNFAFNTFTNGGGSLSPKKAPKADVVTTKPKSGDVPVTRPRKDVTPVQQLALPGPTSKPLALPAPDPVLALPAPKVTSKPDFYVSPDGTVRTAQHQSIENIIQTLPDISKNNYGPRNYQSSGGYEQTLKDFDSIGLNDVTSFTMGKNKGSGQVGTLSDGTKVVSRTTSTSGGTPTLEIQYKNSLINNQDIKIRY